MREHGEAGLPPEVVVSRLEIIEDYEKEFVRLSRGLRQAAFEFRAGRGCGDVPDTAAIDHVSLPDGHDWLCRVVSSRAGELVISYRAGGAFYAWFDGDEAPRFEYADPGSDAVEVPAADAAGCLWLGQALLMVSKADVALMMRQQHVAESET